MNFDKLMLSFYGKNGKVVRLSIDSIFVYCLMALVVAPYLVLVFKNSPKDQRVVKANVEKTLEVPVASSPLASTPVVKTVAPIKQEVAVANSAVSKTFQYKFSNQKVNLENNILSVSFLLSKAKNDGKLSSGSIYIEALDESGKVVGTSSKSLFKFQTARLSSFQVTMPENIKASKIRLKVVENGLESFTFL